MRISSKKKMRGKSLPTKMATPLGVDRAEIDEYDDDDDDDVEEGDCSKGNELMEPSPSPSPSPSPPQPFKLPHGWFVEEKPRPYTPTRKDRYYYEPGTGRKFRSLLSVQRYLTEGIIDMRSTTGGMISRNEDTMQVITHTRGSTSFIKLPNDWIVKKPRNNNYTAGVTDMTDTEPGTGQRFRSLKAVERYLTVENACTATTKLAVKPRTGMQSAPGLKSCLKTVKKRSSFAEEEKFTLKASKHSTKSTEFDTLKEITSGTDSRASNLSEPPAKVKWVLSSSGGYWNPFLDDSIVPDSGKLKWSEAFVLSIRDGVI